MAWYNESGAENDVVISSRVRFARNIAGYPFGSKLTDAARSEIIEKVTKALAPAGLETVDLVAESPLEAASLAEKRLITSEFADEKAPHTLLVDKDEKSTVMIGGEDHVRIQTFAAGLALKDAYDARSRSMIFLTRAPRSRTPRPRIPDAEPDRPRHRYARLACGSSARDDDGASDRLRGARTLEARRVDEGVHRRERRVRRIALPDLEHGHDGNDRG